MLYVLRYAMRLSYTFLNIKLNLLNLNFIMEWISYVSLSNILYEYLLYPQKQLQKLLAGPPWTLAIRHDRNKSTGDNQESTPGFQKRSRVIPLDKSSMNLEALIASYISYRIIDKKKLNYCDRKLFSFLIIFEFIPLFRIVSKSTFLYHYILCPPLHNIQF